MDEPPSYSSGGSSSRADAHHPLFSSEVQTNPSPEYSPSPGRSELVLNASALASSSSSSVQDYVYRCKNIDVNLGSNVWGTSQPSYGANGIIEGKITFTGDVRHVSTILLKVCCCVFLYFRPRVSPSIVLQLEGKVITTFTERGLVSGAATNDIVHTEVELRPSPSGGWASSLPFEIPFPAYASGRQSRLAPTLITYQPGVTCEVKYSLKVTAVRKGLRLNERWAF